VADRGDITERVATLERCVDTLQAEVDRLRIKTHSHSNLLTAHSLIIKIACAASGIAGTVVGAVVTKVLT